MPTHGAEDGGVFGKRLVERINDADGIVRGTQVWSIACSDSCSKCRSPRTFLATNDGLFVYDGARLRHFPGPEEITLRALLYDSQSGRLYSAGSNGFGWWEVDRFGNMEYVPVVGMDQSVLNQDFWRISSDQDGQVYFQSSGRVCIYNPDTGNIRTLLPSAQFRYMHGVGQDVYVQDGDDLCRISAVGAEEKVCAVTDRIMNMVSCGGKTVAALERTGLMWLDGSILRPLDTKTNSILSYAKILSLSLYDNSHMLIGTTSGGFFVADAAGHLCNDLVPIQQRDYPSVLSVARDANGDIWLGTEAGVSRIDGSSQDFFLEDPQLGRVRGVVSIDKDRLLIGSNKGAFIYKNDLVSPVSGTTGSVWNLAKIDGICYIAHDQGLFMLNARDEAVPIYRKSGVMSIVRCNTDKNYFLCGTYNGLALFRQTGRGLEFVSLVENYDGFCRNMHLDGRDDLWIRDSHKGFIKLTLSQDRTRAEERRDYNLKQDSGDHIHYIELGGEELFCCNQEAYSIDQSSGDLVRNPAGDELLAEFESVYGETAGERNASGPFPLEDGSYATGLLGGIRFCYGPRSISQSLYISQIEVLGTRNRQAIAIGDSRARVPHDMNTVRIYLAGNLNGSHIEYKMDAKPGRWAQARVDTPVQLSALRFGNHDIVFRIPGNQAVSATIKLYVLRPWYLTIWAFAGYLVFALLLAIIIREFSLRQARNEQEHMRLKADLKRKSEELANITFNSARRRNQLNEIKKMLTSADVVHRPSEVARVSRETVNQIDNYLMDESDWEKSEEYFNIIYDGLLDKLKSSYPGISKTDMKICVYTKLNLSTKEIADIMNISARSVEMARYRLRKRLGLPPGEDIAAFVKNLA